MRRAGEGEVKRTKLSQVQILTFGDELDLYVLGTCTNKNVKGAGEIETRFLFVNEDSRKERTHKNCL